MKSRNTLLSLTTALLTTAAFAAGNHSGGHTATEDSFGEAGDASKVSRTVTVNMSDSMRFSPDRIEVREGEVVKFVVKNGGKLQHELVIGTKKDLDEHAALMVKFPTMEHDAPYMAHVGPGKNSQLVWNFNRPGEFDFACLIAGHYQAGMVGKIAVAPAAKKS